MTRATIGGLLAAATLLATSSARASFINYSSREINIKIVYYGPGTAGLAENLKYVHSRLDPRVRGKLLSLATETERTLFFDFAPPKLGEIRGFKLRFHLYTVPGKARYGASRKLILKGVDGVVFVADANPGRIKATRASWKNLQANLTQLGYDPQKIPLVVQLDGTGSRRPLTPAKLRRLLALARRPVITANPRTGAGVFDTLKAIAKEIVLELKRSVKRERAKRKQRR